MTDMGTFGGIATEPIEIDAAGRVVRVWTASNGVNHAFLWQNGRATDLGGAATYCYIAERSARRAGDACAGVLEEDHIA